MAKFIYQEIGGITNKGETIVKPRFVQTRQVDTGEFITELTRRSAHTRGELLGMLSNIADTLPYFLAQGHSVRLEGVGVFTPTLAMRNDLPVTETDEEGRDTTHNAKNVVVDTVRYTPDKTLVRTVRRSCHPTHDRFQNNLRAMDTPYTREERLRLALSFLNSHPMLTVADYMEQTGLRHTMAAKELRELSEGDGAQLKPRGRGSHRYYTKAE